MSGRGFFIRVGALARKEVIHILRDVRVVDQGGTCPSPLARQSRASRGVAGGGRPDPPPRAPRAKKPPAREVAA
jgi:hypothetical protein